MKRSILMIALFGLISAQAYAQMPPTVMRAGGSVMALPATYGLIKPENIQKLKTDPQAVQNLLQSLDKNLNYTATPTAVLNLPPHYTNIGVNEGGNDKTFANDARQAYNFALGFVATGNEAYAEKAHQIIDAWATTLVAMSTQQSEDVLNFNTGYMVAAAAMTRNEGGWNAAPFKKFLRKVALPASEQANPNNHGLWAVFMEASIYSFLGDQQGILHARERWQQHLQNSIDAEGVMENEVQRSNTTNWKGGADKGIKGLAYTHYALTPATLAAVIFENSGVPVWNTPSGKRLAKAFHQAAAWTRHPESFPYYKSNNGNLIGVTNAPYFKILNRHYPDENAQWLLDSHALDGDGFRLLSLF